VFTTPLFWTPLLALAVSLAAHAATLTVFPRIGLLDFPERYGYVRGRLPYPVGIVSVLLFLLVLTSASPFGWNVRTAWLAGAVILLAVFTLIDDRKPLPAPLRLFIQAASALFIVLPGNCLGGRICSVTNPLNGFMGGAVIDLHGALPLLSIAVTVLWLLLTVNALNWFDGIPGQVSALSVIGFLTIGFLSLSARVNQPELALVSFVLAGIAAGSLAFELPGLTLIGDTGAMFFGLMLGLLTIYSGGKVATAFLVLGVPLLDLGIVILRRIMKRKSPLRGNATNEHLHHRLLHKGWPRTVIVALTAGIGTVFGLAALFMDTVEKFVSAGLLFLLMLLLSFYSRPSVHPTSLS
jgi:UDP-N-acetylmuramyl pentapeptide phosphotransferase/UDP-N-acetylglucosamine-1-phosphate transferase